MVTNWIQRVAGWDGLLPAVIWGLSALATSILPGDWNPVETLVLVLLAVVMPIAAFLLRLRFGNHAIRSNGCGWLLKSTQYIAFGVGICLLCILDGFVVLHLVAPPGGGVLDDWRPLFITYLVYLALMTLAMYPGPTKALTLNRPSPRL